MTPLRVGRVSGSAKFRCTINNPSIIGEDLMYIMGGVTMD